MKGKLEELGEPVDDLMEVSKVQTQILNLTHNQVDIIDQSTGEFRSTYQILQDIAEVWDSLNSQNRSSLLEIIAGKNRANIGSALIQAFQSGQIQSAFEDAKNAAGTATEEYSKMMQGIQAQFDAFKGAFQEFSNAFIKSDLLKGLVKFGTEFIKLLTMATDKVGSLAVVLTPFLMYFGAKTKTNIFSAIINGIKGLITAETGAITATGALTTAFKVLGGALSGLAIGAIVATISYLADKLIVTAEETEESIREVTSAVGDLANATEELEKSQDDIEKIAQSYSKIATTVNDVNERKTQLLELQGQLTETYKDEANGIDLVNGKYSEQIKKLKELQEEQRRQYELENADKIARARYLANLRVDDIYLAQSSPYENGYDKYSRNDDKKGERALFTIRDIDERVAKLTTSINGAYASLQGTFDANGIYLSGTLEDARNQLKQIIDNYSKLSNIDNETLEKLTQRYKELNDALNQIKEVTPYIEDVQPKGLFTGVFDGVQDALNQAVSDITMQPFYDKLDEAQKKLKQLAAPDDMTIAEYDTLYHEAQELEHILYQMAGDNKDAKQAVSDLFNAYKQGISENGDSLETFVEKFNTSLEESFKVVAENVTNVQNAIEKLGEGKGLSHSEAWKILKEDTEGYLQTIRLVNGEYFLSEEELVKFKDAKIKAAIAELEATNKQYKAEAQLLEVRLSGFREELKLAQEELNLKAMTGQATQKDIENLNKIKIKIAETEKSVKDIGNLWKRNNLLIEELNQNLGTARTLSVAMETELNNAVTALEKEKKAIDNTIDSLNDRKDILNDEKDALQDQLDILNEQKEAIEDTIKKYDAVADAVSSYAKAQADAIQEQIDAMEEAAETIKKEYDEQIDDLKDQNEEREDAIKKEKALADLENAKNQKKRVYSSEKGWDFEESTASILEAQEALTKIENEQKIKALEKERDAKLEGYDTRKKEYKNQIKAFEDYAKQYSDVANGIKQTQNELLADEILGSDWRKNVTKGFGTFDGFNISFNPTMKTENGEVTLTAATISKYIYGLIDEAGEGWKPQNLLDLDAKGMRVDGIEIKKLITNISDITDVLGEGNKAVLETNDGLDAGTQMLKKYTQGYQDLNTQLQSLVENEIASLQASIDAKEKEIKKIDDEIKAYNKYKDTVQKNLKNAQTALEDYKNTMEVAKTETIKASSDMANEVGKSFNQMTDAMSRAETTIFNKHHDIMRWFGEVIASAEEMNDIIGLGGANAGVMGLYELIKGHHANGGVVDYTGLAMMHGSKSNSETVFNASQSKKLYDFVRDTPNLIASVARQAGQITGLSPSSIANNTNSVNVNIGQIVANNPQELTRNLDTHLDSYFRRKLTQSYAQ